ncbi:type I-E CRISPR-associated protein Cse1/CasA [Lactobacillus crispatus]|uniref:type I-E CRISPR-associated protein Cse1/CasA n=1 Tax=Lactobacillus crispatus TaxID=47770 RepID=UPI003BF991E3
MFTPRSKAFKDQIRLDELARWIITYHSYSTVSEKNLVALDDKKTKFQKSAGWLYRLSPCFVAGKNLFETFYNK